MPCGIITFPPSNLTFPPVASVPLFGTPSGPERHPGFEPGTPGSPGPITAADGKALSSGGGSGGCIPDVPVGQEVDCPEPMLPGPNGTREEGKAKRQASGTQSLGKLMPGKA